MRTTLLLSLGLVVVAASACRRTEGPPEARPARSLDELAEQPASAPALPPKVTEPQGVVDEEGAGGVPVSLTSSDGAGLKLTGFVARGVVDEPLAFTELHLTFRNPEARPIEGQFEITLPPNATVSRFAMKQLWGWQEGEVVELQAARRAYEDFLHRRQDPALLEKKAGNQFRARVFPIPPSAEKELIVSYSQELVRADQPYRIYLRGLPQIDTLDLRVLVGKREQTAGGSSLGGTTISRTAVEVQKRGFMPDRDFTVPAGGQGTLIGLRHENLAVGRVTPITEARPDPIGSLAILFDTSASRALGFAGQIQRLAALLDALRASAGAKTPVRLICFDQDVEEVYAGTLGGLGRDALDRVRARRPLGASDLGKALGALAGGAKAQRVVVITDGIATAGETEGNALRDLVAKLGPAGVERLDVIVDGGIRDEELLKKLVSAGLARDGVVIEAGLPPATVARKLGNATSAPLAVSVPGSQWVWPAELRGLQPGDQALVYADLPRDRPFDVQLGPVKQTVNVAEAPRPLLERAWVNARIQRLMHQRDTLAGKDEDLREALKKQVVDLSTKFRVMSDFTALLVLETEADYARFNIDRRALADIMVVGANGIELVDRRAPGYQIAVAPTIPTAPPGASIAVDGVAAARKGAANQGVLGALGGRRGGMANLFGDAHGGDAAGARDRARGSGGLGLAATGQGGGGTGEGTIGALGDLGRGPGGTAPAPAKAAAPPPAEVAEAKRDARPAAPVTVARPPAEKPAAEPRAARRIRPPQDEAGQSGGGASVQPGEAVVRGSIDTQLIRRVINMHRAQVRMCYERALRQNPGLRGRLAVQFTIGPEGSVLAATIQSSTLNRPDLEACVTAMVRGWSFPRPPDGGAVVVTYPFTFAGRGPIEPPPPPQPAPPPPPPAPVARPTAQGAGPYEGKLLEVMNLLKRGQPKQALGKALVWREEEPGDVLALVALGEALEALGQRQWAARAYGSIIDLFPSRADLRRFAGERLDRLGLRDPAALALAVDSYRQAVKQRPDHPASHRNYAYALLRAGRPEAAFDAIVEGARQQYPQGRFAGVDRILREDVGLIAAAWLKREPQKDELIRERVRGAGAELPTEGSLRFVLNWETDANDVDFHIHDARGGHAFYSQRQLPSGGELYADVTTGYGPECFTIPYAAGGRAPAYPYTLKAHYYSRGPMGYGMGRLEVIEHDGRGGLKFDERPFVIMVDRAMVELGTVAGPLK
jgi:TonB family protein